MDSTRCSMADNAPPSGRCLQAWMLFPGSLQPVRRLPRSAVQDLQSTSQCKPRSSGPRRTSPPGAFPTPRLTSKQQTQSTKEASRNCPLPRSARRRGWPFLEEDPESSWRRGKQTQQAQAHTQRHRKRTAVPKLLATMPQPQRWTAR